MTSTSASDAVLSSMAAASIAIRSGRTLNRVSAAVPSEPSQRIADRPRLTSSVAET